MKQSQIEDDPLDIFLSAHQPASIEEVNWHKAAIRLELKVYLTESPPPGHLVTSARCIVLAGSSVLVLSNEDDDHILPGGRREPGESMMSAAIREVREETSLNVKPERQLGVMVFRHLTPKPERYPYPYPTFIQIVYLAGAEPGADVVVNDEWERDGAFIPSNDERIQRLPPGQQRLLNTAFGIQGNVQRVRPRDAS